MAAVFFFGGHDLLAQGWPPFLGVYGWFFLSPCGLCGFYGGRPPCPHFQTSTKSGRLSILLGLFIDILYLCSRNQGIVPRYLKTQSVMFKNKKLAAIVEALQCSHPHYLGEDFYLSVSFDSPRGFRVLFFMEDAYSYFITDYQFEVFAAVSRLYNVSVSIKVCQGLPVVCMHAGSYC